MNKELLRASAEGEIRVSMDDKLYAPEEGACRQPQHRGGRAPGAWLSESEGRLHACLVNHIYYAPRTSGLIPIQLCRVGSCKAPRAPDRDPKG